MTREQLEKRIRDTESRLFAEKLKNHEKIRNIGWGAGMRRVKVGPVCTRERELEQRLQAYRDRLAAM